MLDTIRRVNREALRTPRDKRTPEFARKIAEKCAKRALRPDPPKEAAAATSGCAAEQAAVDAQVIIRDLAQATADTANLSLMVEEMTLMILEMWLIMCQTAP